MLERVAASESGNRDADRLVAPAWLRRALGSPSSYIFLAVREREPVGFVSGYRFPRLDDASDQVYVFDIEVLPELRRQGIGRRLLEALLEACGQERVSWAWAGTARENVAAQALFASVGGERGGETYVEFEFTPPRGPAEQAG